MKLIDEIKTIIRGDVYADEATLEKYSRDASIFQVMPQVVVFPRDVRDIEAIVSFVYENQEEYPELSITARAAGTDMTGGPIGEGIILDTTRYMGEESVDLENMRATVEPGVFFRDFEKDTLPEHVTLPVYPASKSIAALGGMIMNNCGGEKSLQYGQIRNFVESVDMTLYDGKTYTFASISEGEIAEKMLADTSEAEVYRKTYELIQKHYDVIKAAKPHTSKNSSGYALWDVYDKETGKFNLAQLFVGSQGTLGIMSKATVRLVESKEHNRLVVLFLKDWSKLPSIVNRLIPLKLESLETFDDVTLKLGIRFMPQIAKRVGENFFVFLFRFWPEAIMSIKLFGLPKLIILCEIAEKSETLAQKKAQDVVDALCSLHLVSRIITDEKDAEKYWIMRRESFNLLRKKVGDKKTAPFVEDICVSPDNLPVVLPKVIAILEEYDIPVNIAGHAGDGNIHIIPLMRLDLPEERAKIIEVSNKVYNLVLEYKGTITAEHNDGIIRTPYVEKMFGKKIYGIFQEVKEIFDPHNMFNPGKKVNGTFKYLEDHIATE